MRIRVACRRPLTPVSDSAHNSDAAVVFDDVTMAYGGRQVFGGLSCMFPRGKISVVLGGSGSGKSTLLRLVGGLTPPSGGRIYVDGDEITHLGESALYAVRNKLGMMFQGGALLDSLTVFDNLAFPLREHTKLGEGEIAERVHKCLESVGLTDVDDLLPGELSGGMVKRVALARSLMRNPVVLLVDEPFSGLDPLSTKLVESLLVSVNRSSDATMLVVSHHIPSTMRMADWVIMLLPSGVVQGTPEEMMASSDKTVSRFLHEDLDDSEEVLRHAREFDAEAPPAPGRVW